MPRDSITYKSIDPGCVLDIQAVSGDFTEEKLITSARRHRRPSAGLIVETEQQFFPGTMVLMDIAIEKSAKFRSRGMVAWCVPGTSPNRPYKMGVMIFKMEKLAMDGLPFSDSLMPPPRPTFSIPAPGTTSDSTSEKENDPTNEEFPLVTKRPTPPPQQPDEAPVRPQGNSRGNSWELLTQCAPSVRATDWQRAFHFPDAVHHVVQEGEHAIALALSSPTFTHKVTGMTLRDAGDETASIDSSIPPTLVSFGKKSPDELDLDISVDPNFDTEGAMIRAFDRMHELYGQRDKLGAARFAVSLARSVITSEAAICNFISNEKYELIPEVTSPPGDAPWTAAPRSARFGIHGVAIQTDSAIRVDHPLDHPEYEFDEGGMSTRNILVAPISRDGYSIGTLELRNSPRETGFTNGESDVLTYIGSSIAEFIHNSLPDERSSPPDSPI